MVFPYRPNEKPIRIQINKQSYTGQAIFKVFVSFHKVRTFIKYAFHGQNVSRMSYYKMTRESSKFYYITQNNLFINNRILKYFWVLKTGKVWNIDLWKLERFYWALILISVPIICDNCIAQIVPSTYFFQSIYKWQEVPVHTFTAAINLVLLNKLP